MCLAPLRSGRNIWISPIDPKLALLLGIRSTPKVLISQACRKRPEACTASTTECPLCAARWSKWTRSDAIVPHIVHRQDCHTRNAARGSCRRTGEYFGSTGGHEAGGPARTSEDHERGLRRAGRILTEPFSTALWWRSRVKTAYDGCLTVPLCRKPVNGCSLVVAGPEHARNFA